MKANFKKIKEGFKKSPFLYISLGLGGVLAYNHFFGSVKKVGKVEPDKLTPNINHAKIAQELLDSMSGLNFSSNLEVFRELATLPTANDVVEVYNEFSEIARSNGSNDSLTEWIDDEWTVPFTPARENQERALKRLRSLKLS